MTARPQTADFVVMNLNQLTEEQRDLWARVEALYEQARIVAAELGHALGEGGTGGGSDGNFTAALGVPTLDGLGAVGDGAHAIHEHVRVADLPWRAALLAGLIHRLGTAS